MAYKIIKSAINRYAAGSVYPKASGEYIHENDKNEMFSSSNVKKKSDYFIKTSNEDKNIKPEEKSETTVNNKNYDSKMLNYWLESIQKYSLKNAATGQEFITPEIKALFSSEKTSINMNELIDENGNVKQGYELFDLNHDNKLDDFEISYFTSGGSMLKTDNKILDVENFVDVYYKLDRFDNKYDKNASEQNRKMLYKFMLLSNELIDELSDFPEGIQELYASKLADVKDVIYNYNSSSGGYFDGKNLGLKDFNNKNYFKAALFHELTHCVLDTNPDLKEEAITQEVQTFYMEWLYYNYKKGDDIVANFGRDFPDFIVRDYKMLEENNPDITKLDIAKVVFLVNRFDDYKSSYKQYDKDKYIYNADYVDIGGYFTEPSNKKDIYETGIQKAFANATLKDENGKELITDEIKKLFSPERPIITCNDLVDENHKIKPGLELFDLDGDGFLNSEKTLFSYITYNDIPRLIKMLDEWGNLSAKNKFKSKGPKASDGISTTESRKIISENLLNTDNLYGTFNFHCQNKGSKEKL